MSYIGRGVDAISNVEKLDNITFSGTTTYALTKSSAAFTPVGANNILISIDGVVQMGNFSVSTTNIVFDWSPTSSNTCNFILHYGTGVLNVPADGSIVAAKMAANSVDSASYVDLSIDTAHIGATQVTGAKLNTDVISAQTALAVAPADADEFLVSDGGVLKRIDYSLIKSANTPAFSVKRHAATQSVSSGANTKVEFNTENFDTDSAYDASTNYRFTVPSGAAGKYFFNAKVAASAGNANMNRASLKIYKNGSLFTTVFHGFETNPIRLFSPEISAVMDLSVSNYIEIFAYYETVNGAALNIDDGEEGSVQFYGFKLA